MYKNRLSTIILPVAIAIALVFGIFIGTFFSKSESTVGGIQIRSTGYGDNKIVQTMSLIDKLYLNPVNLDSLAEKVVPLLIEELDPHSTYIPAKDLVAVTQNLDGEFDGVGIIFNMVTDTAIVLNVIPQGPSDRAGIVNGDRIIMVDDTIVAGRDFNQDRLVKMLRGRRGTTVNLQLERSGISGLVPITVERGKIPLKSVTAALMIDESTAYMKLSSFSKYSHLEIDTTMTRLRSEGMKKLIFDLRGNSGGYLDQAITIANDFLPAGDLIVYTEDRYNQQIKEYSDGNGKYTDLEIALLIDEGSASSSEILAGAIQDNDRGTVIGRRSFGKGLVQQEIPFGDGSALRLTIARYYTPTGRSIQKPYTEGTEGYLEYGQDLRQRYEHNEFFTADSIKFADSLRFVTPKGKVVYGGGGIMPDIFVPLDTTEITKYYIEVAGKNILYRYTLDYSDKHRSAINSITTVQELNDFLDADNRLLDDFVRYAARNGVPARRDEIERSRQLITSILRAYIGRNTPLEDSGFYSQSYRADNVILEAIEVLSK